MNAYIEVNQIGKKFCKSLQRSLIYGVEDIILPFNPFVKHQTKNDQLRQDEFWALQNISFRIEQGQTLGIIGPNGSGKTTLLKLINGIFMPNQGSVRIKGKVGGLIQVGAGFHPMLSGRENIYINGTILGMRKKEIDEKFDQIVEFADIGDFLDSPVKHYSTGMFIRLGFAVAVHSDPDILLVDEVLAVGDKDFQLKCYQKMYDIRKSGTIVLLVSHDEYTIREQTQNCLYLANGEQKFFGPSEEGINYYLEDVYREKKIRQITSVDNENIENKRKVDLIDLSFFNCEDLLVESLPTGSFLKLKLTLEAYEDIPKPIFSVNFYGDGGFKYCANSDYEQLKWKNLPQGQHEITIEIPECHLPVGKYLCSTSVASEDVSHLIDFQMMQHELLMTRASFSRGSVKLKTKWDVSFK